MKDLIGKVVGGCEILEEVGQGGMGVVYRARQISLERVVAIKVLAQHLALDKNFVRRFQHEARAIARVSHPNILTIFDVGEENGIYYMIMEFIEGRSVSEMLEDIPTLEPRFAVDIVRQAALGLECAQQNGIIHRDIKPDNIMVTSQNIAKVSDFGLAKEVEGSMTVTDAVMGTPAYMSPEQCDGRKLDGRTDIYSLGGTLFRMITGRLPFEAETAMSMMYRHKHEPLTPPQELNPGVPVSIGNVIVRMMAKQREDRYQTMGEVVQAIDAAWKETESGGEGKHIESSTALEATIKLDMEDTSPAQPAFTAGAEVEKDPAKARELLEEAEGMASRGDVVGAARLLGDAARYDPDSDTVKSKRAGIVAPEIKRLLEAGKKMLVAGQYSEAARSFRNAADLDPSNAEARQMLKRAEERLLKKREAINEIRGLIREAKFEEVSAKWDELPPELREKNLEKQVERIKTVTIPAMQLVKQGDAAQESGDLAEAAELYQKVLSLDPNNQRAKEGLKEIERRRTRLEVLTREGYDAFMERDFQKAIDIWHNALKIAPDPQVKKRIVEASFELAGELEGKEGGLQRIVHIWEDILEIDPSNRRAAERLDRDKERVEKTTKLGEKASGDFSRGNYRAAAKAWKELLKVDPANKKVAASLSVARKRLFRRRLRVFFGALVLFALLAGGTQYFSETIILKEARKYLQKGQHEAAVKAIESSRLPFLIYRDRMQEIMQVAKVRTLDAKAERAYREGNLEEAAAFLDRAKRFANEQQKQQIFMRLHRMRREAAVSRAEEALEKRDFEAASGLISEAAEAMAAVEKEEESRLLRNKARLYDKLDRVKRSMGRAEDRDLAAVLKEAYAVSPDDSYVAEFLEKTGFNFRAAEFEVRQALSAIEEHKFDEAEPLLKDAMKHDPSGTEAAILLAFVEDNLRCAVQGMVLIPPRGLVRISVNPRWGESERRQSFCIDRYEYPNREGTEPRGSVTYLQAKSLCEKQGKRLCTVSEWAYSCGTRRDFRFGYGPNYIKDRCNVSRQGKAPSGSFRNCRNAYGAFDMVGNVAEWVRNPNVAGMNSKQFVVGGYWMSDPGEATCFSRSEYSPILSSGTVGFRCCMDLPKEER